MCNSNAAINSCVRSCIMSFPHISLSSQNCNSLNISTECDKQLSKVVAISSLCTNIIFLSDIRLGANASHVNKLEKLFLTNTSKSYNFFTIPVRVIGVSVLFCTVTAEAVCRI